VKIAIATVQVPFISGGAEIHAAMLREELDRRGFETDIVTLPFKWYPPEQIIDCMKMARLADLTEVNGQKIDRVIAMKFPAYYIRHANKVLWLLHQHRQAYELWGTPFGDLHTMKFGKEVRDLIVRCDNALIPQARKIFTNSATTAERLSRYNGITATPLYHPPRNSENLHCSRFDDYIFYPSRISPMKRQDLLVEALPYCTSPVRVVLAGGYEPEMFKKLQKIIERNHLRDRVEIRGMISEREKIELYSECLGVYFGPYQEDYGYVTLEAFFSGKPVITHPDAGGPLEFVTPENGFIVDPKPEKIAKVLDFLYNHRDMAKKMGRHGRTLMETLPMNWDYIIRELTT
jgi:glycosyltransferase involved in cell wall biosynthesis